MANCRNCEKYWCEHKYGEILQDECADYQPHYIDVDMPIGYSEDKQMIRKEEPYYERNFRAMGW